MQEIYVPATGMANEGVYLAEWLKQPGEQIAAGEEIALIETDKAELSLESPGEGILGRHRFPADTTVSPGATVSVLLEPGESEPDATEPDATEPAGDAEDGVEPAERTPVSSADEGGARSKPLPDRGTPIEAENDTAPPAAGSSQRENGSATGVTGAALTHDDRRRDPVTGELEPYELSPRRRRETLEHGMPSASQSADQAREQPGSIEPEPSPAEPGDRYRAAVASAVSRSWKEIPHFAVNREIRVERLQDVLRSFKALDSHVTFTDVILKLFALSLIERVGASDIDLGLAVATDKGVAIPVLTDVARRDLLGIATSRRTAVERALNQQMNADDRIVPHSSVSNLGAYGADSFTGIVPVGQTSLLTVGAAAQRPVVVDGQLAVGTTMHLTLNVDHREWDGAHAAEVLQRCAAIASEPAVLTALT